MSSSFLSAPDNLDWKKAYMAAVLEKDRTQLPGLVQNAREKVSARLRELWDEETVPCEELEAIHDALYLLQALLSSLLYRDETALWSKFHQGG